MVRKINRGMTLIELIIYVSIFTILMTGFLSALFYIQRTIFAYTHIYKTKKCVYQQLSLIQDYLQISNNFQLAENYIKINTSNINTIFQLNNFGNFEINYLKNNAPQKTIQQCGETRFSTITFTTTPTPQTLTEKTSIQATITFSDMNNHPHTLTTPLLAPPPNL